MWALVHVVALSCLGSMVLLALGLNVNEKKKIRAVVGGLTSPGGAVVGGFLVGVLENLAGLIIGSELKLTFALVIIVGVLMFRPSGLFGRRVVERV